MKKSTVLLALTFAALLPLTGQAEEVIPASPHAPRFAEPPIQPLVEYRVTLLKLKSDAPRLVETGVFEGLESAQDETLESRFGTVVERYQGSVKNGTSLTHSLTKFTKEGNVGYDLDISPLIERSSKAKEFVQVRTTIQYEQRLPGKPGSKDVESFAKVKTNPVMSVGEISVQTWENSGTRFVLVVKLTNVTGATFKERADG
ncbi:hypothetical protein [Pseudomonas sp. NPDC096950]|uniref:hypothetical protein n=1 Tax=Pseudomonas sp. NPDC096950 TaxID=3364485 RepID=UPI00383A87FB